MPACILCAINTAVRERAVRGPTTVGSARWGFSPLFRHLCLLGSERLRSHTVYLCHSLRDFLSQHTALFSVVEDMKALRLCDGSERMDGVGDRFLLVRLLRGLWLVIGVSSELVLGRDSGARRSQTAGWIGRFNLDCLLVALGAGAPRMLRVP